MTQTILSRRSSGGLTFSCHSSVSKIIGIESFTEIVSRFTLLFCSFRALILNVYQPRLYGNGESSIVFRCVFAYLGNRVSICGTFMKYPIYETWIMILRRRYFFQNWLIFSWRNKVQPWFLEKGYHLTIWRNVMCYAEDILLLTTTYIENMSTYSEFVLIRVMVRKTTLKFEIT